VTYRSTYSISAVDLQSWEQRLDLTDDKCEGLNGSEQLHPAPYVDLQTLKQKPDLVDKHSKLTHTQQLHPTSVVDLPMSSNVPLILFLSTDHALYMAAGIRHPEHLLLTITHQFV